MIELSRNIEELNVVYKCYQKIIKNMETVFISRD